MEWNEKDSRNLASIKIALWCIFVAIVVLVLVQIAGQCAIHN